MKWEYWTLFVIYLPAIFFTALISAVLTFQAVKRLFRGYAIKRKRNKFKVVK